MSRWGAVALGLALGVGGTVSVDGFADCALFGTQESADLTLASATLDDVAQDPAPYADQRVTLVADEEGLSLVVSDPDEQVLATEEWR